MRTASAAKFGHHSNPATDFCAEVETLESEAMDQNAGAPPRFDLAERADRALQFRVGGNLACIAA